MRRSRVKNRRGGRRGGRAGRGGGGDRISIKKKEVDRSRGKAGRSVGRKA